MPHMGILSLKEMYKIIMDEFLSSASSFLYLWREPIMIETHFGFSSVHLFRITCWYGHICAKPSACFRLRRQNPNVLPPDFPPWFTPLQFLKELQGVISGSLLWNSKVSHSTLRSEPQYLWPFLDYLLKCFTAFLFPTYKNYGIAPCQVSGGTATKGQ